MYVHLFLYICTFSLPDTVTDIPAAKRLSVSGKTPMQMRTIDGREIVTCPRSECRRMIKHRTCDSKDIYSAGISEII